MDYMGVKQSYSSNDIDIDTQYQLTKEIFIDGDWKYMNGKT